MDECERELRLSVIVPATNDPPTLERALEAIDRGIQEGDEVIVVRDPPLTGPALARNAGAALAVGDVLVFVDADVEIDIHALDRIRAAFHHDRALTALFGSYDDDPAARGVVSGFRNLLHHHVHHAGAGPATTFWAGLGAIRRDAFLASGGFDGERFAAPSVEDVELGMRLSAGGERIRLDPTIQGTHLKRWTLWSMVRTDFLCRGIPWVGLLLANRSQSTTLNLGWRHRMSALASVGAVPAIALLELTLLVAFLVALVALNHSFYALLLRRRGPVEATIGVLLHAVHHLTAVASVPAGMLVVGRTRADRVFVRLRHERPPVRERRPGWARPQRSSVFRTSAPTTPQEPPSLLSSSRAKRHGRRANNVGFMWKRRSHRKAARRSAPPSSAEDLLV